MFEILKERKASVRGIFYPYDFKEIENMINSFDNILDESIKDKELLNKKTNAIIVPHAGYIYSGFTANIAYRILKNQHIKRAIVIGPSHRVGFDGVSGSFYETYNTPKQNLQIEIQYLLQLKKMFNISFIPEAHQEHSTEVQMPFLAYYFENISVVELVYGHEQSKNISLIIDYILKDNSNAVIISSDLSHFYNQSTANKLDSICIEAVQKSKIDILNSGCEACGEIGIGGMILSAIKNNLQAEILDYRTSADASGDKSRVVGYLSAIYSNK